MRRLEDRAETKTEMCSVSDSSCEGLQACIEDAACFILFFSQKKQAFY